MRISQFISLLFLSLLTNVGQVEAQLPTVCDGFDLSSCREECAEIPILLNQCLSFCSSKSFACSGRANSYVGPGVWRPGSGDWFRALPEFDSEKLFDPSTSFLVGSIQFGLPGDIPVGRPLAAFGCEQCQISGFTPAPEKLKIFRQTTGEWFQCRPYANLSGDINAAVGRQAVISAPCPAEEPIQFGLPGDIPLEGDFDGDGVQDLVVWRPSSGNWFIRFSIDDSVHVVQWGLPGDFPLVGDFDGDLSDDIAVFRPADGNWFVRLVGTDGTAQPVEDTMVRQWGLGFDHPFAGDFDRDGISDLAVWRPIDGNWFVCPSTGSYQCFVNGFVTQFGLPGDIPLTEDFDLDRVSDFAVWRPQSGTWFYLSSSQGTTHFREWGLPTDIPLGLGVKDLSELLLFPEPSSQENAIKK